MRKAHKLRENRKSEIPQRIIFFDTETEERETGQGKIHVLKLGWACYVDTRTGKEEWKYFEDVETFWNFVEKYCYAKTKLYLVAHNIVFDLFVVDWINELKKREWKRRKMFENTQVFFAEFRKENRTIALLDSYNYFHTSIEEMGKIVGREKMKVDFKSSTKEELSEYCKNDVEILKKFFLNFLEFWKQNDMGVFAKTIAGCAFNTYRHKFLKDIYIHSDAEVDALELESYRGGRTEVFHFGRNENISVLDVNSMYPFVMKKYKYPSKLVAFGKRISKKELKEYLQAGFLVIARVKIKTDENVFGKKDEKRGLIFPIGEFEVVLNTEELKYAFEKGYVKKVYEFAIYEGEYLFSDFVDYFYSLRKQAKSKTENLFYKLILNSLYGKFAQKSERWEECDYDFEEGIYSYYDIDENKRFSVRSLGGKVERKVGEELSFNSFVAIAAEITANARMELYKLMLTAGKENVIYCDTDSLFINEEGKKRLESYIGDGLGMLKVDKEFEVIEIKGLKDYEGITKNNEEIVKLKGIKKTAQKIDDNKYLQYQFCRFRTQMRKQILTGVLMREVIKELKREYKKGIIDDFGQVFPLAIFSSA